MLDDFDEILYIESDNFKEHYSKEFEHFIKYILVRCHNSDERDVVRYAKEALYQAWLDVFE